MIPTSASLQSSETTSFGDIAGRSANSGQHGQFLTLQLGGRGNTATPSFTDSAGKVPIWVWVAVGIGGIVLAVILRKKKA